MKPQRSIFKTWVAPIVGAVAIVPTLAVAIWAVLHGRGATAYANVYGLAIQYTSLLIFLLVLVLVAAGAYVARVIYFWRNSYDRSAKLRRLRSIGSSDDSNCSS